MMEYEITLRVQNAEDSWGEMKFKVDAETFREIRDKLQNQE
jgi:alpha-glucuronidase